MTELETLERAKVYMEKLANGINPIDGSLIPDSDIVNNVRLSRCFFYVADTLRRVIENGGIVPQANRKKSPFSLPLEKHKDFVFSDEPITISEIIKRLNDLTQQENMLKLTTSTVVDWLVSINILYIEPTVTGHTTKRPTAQGIALGIGVENRTGLNGPYSVVVYNREAQQFLLDNLESALALEQQKTQNQGLPWTQEDDQYLRELFQQGVSNKEIAITLKRNSSAVRARLKKLGLLASPATQ